MKYIITESKLEKTAIHYLNEMYGDFERYRTDKRPDSVFYVKDKKAYMEYDLELNAFWVDYPTIWQDLKNIFNFEYFESQRILTKWLEETYKLKGVKPMNYGSIHPSSWDRLFN